MAVDVLAGLRAVPGGTHVLAALGERDDVWVVGGAVRDVLLGRPAKDLDLVVAGDAGELAAQFGEVREVHDRFGTTTIEVDGATVNVATARTERYPHPGALPEVEPAALEDDLARRDFTVNAIAADLAGELHAAPRALDDLGERRLRVLHPGSFLDDPTRLWRLARYSARLGFEAEPETERLAREAVAARAMRTVTGPRIGAELRLALDEPDPQAALEAAGGLGLLPASVSPRREPFDAAAALLPDQGGRGLLALAAAALDMDPERLHAWLDGVGMPARERDTIVLSAADARALAVALSAAGRPSEIAAAVGRRPVEAVALAGAVGAPEAARRWLEGLRDVRLEITGDDLLAAGIPAGPELGERLARALAARLDGEAIGREQELAVALA